MVWTNEIIFIGLWIWVALIIIVIIIKKIYKNKIWKIEIEFNWNIINKWNYYIWWNIEKDLYWKIKFLFRKDIELNKININYKITYFASLWWHQKDETIFNYDDIINFNKNYLNWDNLELKFNLSSDIIKKWIEKEFKNLSFISKSVFKNYNFRQLTINFNFDIKWFDFKHEFIILLEDNQIKEFLQKLSNEKHKSNIKINKYWEYESINKENNEDFFEDNWAIV